MRASELRSIVYSTNFHIRQNPIRNQQFSWEQQPFFIKPAVTAGQN